MVCLYPEVSTASETRNCSHCKKVDIFTIALGTHFGQLESKLYTGLYYWVIKNRPHLESLSRCEVGVRQLDDLTTVLSKWDTRFIFYFQDVLENDDINIDWMFKISFATDLSKVRLS